MPVIEGFPDEREAYLAAILMDRSGLDTGEFLLNDRRNADGCFRARPYQWPWWRCADQYQADCCSRDVGKSESLALRAIGFVFNFPDEEMVIGAPELNNLEPIIIRLEHRIFSCRLLHELIQKGRRSVTHRPFFMQFTNGARILGRIPQRSGMGFKGLHTVRLELDEAQDLTNQAWGEVIETLRTEEEGAEWRIHGVPRGTRGKFWEFTQDSSDFTVHRITAMHRPGWNDVERQRKIRQYGSRDDPDYRRNILGEHGDVTNALFVLHKLMRCVDDDQSSDYNQNVYHHVIVRDTDLTHEARQRGLDDGDPTVLSGLLVEKLDLPARHQGPGFEVIWMGMDVGFTTDPSEILVFAEYHPSAAELRADKAAHRATPAEGTSRLRCIARFTLRRIDGPLQVAAIYALLDFYNPRAFAMDKSGNGLVLYQDVLAALRAAEAKNREKMRARAQTFKGYNFSEKVLVEFDDAAEAEGEEYESAEERAEEVGMRRNVLEYSTDCVRRFVDQGRLMLPWEIDDEDVGQETIINEMQGQTFCGSDDTEILTKRGWLRYDQVRVGDETLGLVDDRRPARSCWTAITDVHVFDGVREMLQLEGQCHHSLTTPNHRWRVTPYPTAKYFVWRTSEDAAKQRVQIPIVGGRLDQPIDPVYSDNFVRLVGWFFSEGNWHPTGAFVLAQSPSANPIHTAAIETMLTEMFGPGIRDPGRGNIQHGYRWSMTSAEKKKERTDGYEHCNSYRILDAEARRIMPTILDRDKVIDPAFLCALTGHQLQLFIKTALAGDGCCFTRERIGRNPTEVRSFTQLHPGRVASFEMACALAGIPTHTVQRANAGCFTTALLRREFVHTSSMEATLTWTDGPVWCPTTTRGTWLARRHGSVFFTGNSYSKSPIDQFGRRRRVFGEGRFHAFDAMRMFALGYVQTPIEEMMAATTERKPVFDQFIQY